MTDSARKNAQARLEFLANTLIENEDRREVLQAEIRKLEAEYDRMENEKAAVETFLRVYQNFADLDPTSAGSQDLYGPAKGLPPLRVVHGRDLRVQNPPRAIIADEVARVIETEAKPVPVPDLLTWLEIAHLPIHGKNPAATLNTMLWRESDRFVRLKSGYWLKNQPFASEGYDPKPEDEEDYSQYSDDP